MDWRFLWPPTRKVSRAKRTACFSNGRSSPCGDCSSSIPTGSSNIRSFITRASAAALKNCCECSTPFSRADYVQRTGRPAAAPLDPTAAIVVGSVLAHYRFEAKLGSGSFATVFKARDLTLERTVAVKVIQPGKLASPAAVLNEARAAAALQHPNVCTVYSVDDSEGVPLIVMEYVPGGSLSGLLGRGRSLRNGCASSPRRPRRRWPSRMPRELCMAI